MSLYSVIIMLLSIIKFVPLLALVIPSAIFAGRCQCKRLCLSKVNFLSLPLRLCFIAYGSYQCAAGVPLGSMTFMQNTCRIFDIYNLPPSSTLFYFARSFLYTMSGGVNNSYMQRFPQSASKTTPMSFSQCVF